MGEAVCYAFVVTRKEPVDQDQAGLYRRREAERIDPAQRSRRDTEQIIEDEDQQKAREEGGHRQRSRREEPGSVIDQAPLPKRSDDSERNRNRQSDQEREPGQLDR